ncbi:MAG: hypothetical protein INQ03_10800 [Candidatus Heimdallarchaeota archaeon]|nr:hypothetical protein [Candidatus Heimdallarchaeota archaeon]
MILYLVLLILLVSLVAIHRPTSSILINTKDGHLIHLQVDEDETRQIYEKKLNHYAADEIITADEATLLVLGYVDEYILGLDFDTGMEIWKKNLDSFDSHPKAMVAGDLTGDGNDEIVLSRSFQLLYPDISILLFKNNGQLLQIIPSIRDTTSYYGVDNLIIHDIDADGKNELIMSFGAALWDPIQKNGRYRIDIWRWEDTAMKMQHSWEGEDCGGNTKMIIYEKKNYIITGGWYNNPIRAFDAAGNKIWETTLFSSDPHPHADVELKWFTDTGGTTRLLAISNDYWRQKVDSVIFIINPDNGEILEQIDEPDGGFLGPSIVAGSYFYREIQYKLDNNNVAVRMEMMDLHDGRILRELEVPFEYSRAVLNGRTLQNQLATICIEQDFILVQDSSGFLWMINNKQIRKLYHEPLISLSTILVLNDAKALEGEVVIDNQNGIGEYLVEVLANSLNLLSIIGNKWIERYRLYKFNQPYKQNWRNQFYYRMNKIILRLINTNVILENQLELDEMLLEVGEEVEVDHQEFTEIGDTLMNISHNQNFPTLKHWLSYTTQKLNQLKIGDIAILLELLERFPSTMIKTELVDLFPHAKKSTIYKRINLMEDLELIERSRNLADENMTISRIVLSQVGLELITSLYLTLEKSFTRI